MHRSLSSRKCLKVNHGRRGGELKSATIDSYGDHRIAMSSAIDGLNCDMKIDDVECINSSFPNFKEILDSLY